MRDSSSAAIIQALSAVAATLLLAGCSGGSAIAPHPASTVVAAYTGVHAPSDFNPFDPLNIDPGGNRDVAGYYSCPATGPLKYVTDASTIGGAIYIYAGKFAGQLPCGEISEGLNGPRGMFVAENHDLYVANNAASNVLVFHRGQTKPYNTYFDPTDQYVGDVAVARDGTVITTNIFSQGSPYEPGSISTWIGGLNGGRFVGNYVMVNVNRYGGFLTVQKDGTVYYDDTDSSNFGGLFRVSCPAGICGTQTQVTGVSFHLAGGVASDDSDDVLVTDSGDGFPALAETFELPNPNPKTFPLLGIPIGMAINKLDHHWFVADANNQYTAEYAYPSGKLIGTVLCPSPCSPDGIAVDPGHAR
jgi:hypothetical protein